MTEKGKQMTVQLFKVLIQLKCHGTLQVSNTQTVLFSNPQICAAGASPGHLFYVGYVVNS